MPHFNPRSPCGERQLRTAFQIQKFYISIHAPRAGSDGNLRLHCPLHCQISIHAPRAGSDPSLLLVQGGLTHISIHAPRAGSDAPTAPICSMRAAFQSTLPVRGATKAKFRRTAVRAFQSTLPVRGATLPFLSAPMPSLISIHAPRAGSDVPQPRRWCSRPISIHAPRAGSDALGNWGILSGKDFNPRSPCGERQPLFQALAPPGNFNPRSPCGERPFSTTVEKSVETISIHAPRAGSDMTAQDISRTVNISIHAPRAGSDTVLLSFMP